MTNNLHASALRNQICRSGLDLIAIAYQEVELYQDQDGHHCECDEAISSREVRRRRGCGRGSIWWRDRESRHERYVLFRIVTPHRYGEERERSDVDE